MALKAHLHLINRSALTHSPDSRQTDAIENLREQPLVVRRTLCSGTRQHNISAISKQSAVSLVIRTTLGVGIMEYTAASVRANVMVLGKRD
jgi:hypothetical protein